MIVEIAECFLVLWAVLEGEKFGVVRSTHSGTLIDILRTARGWINILKILYSLLVKSCGNIIAYVKKV